MIAAEPRCRGMAAHPTLPGNPPKIERTGIDPFRQNLTDLKDAAEVALPKLLALVNDALLAADKSTMVQLGVCLLGEGYLLAGRLEEAHARAEEALSFAQTRRERAYEATTLRLLGEIDARRDPPLIESAEEHYHRALALASELEMRPLVAHCHLGLSKLYRRINKRDQGQGHLATAKAMYRELGMTYWPERASAEFE